MPSMPTYFSVTEVNQWSEAKQWECYEGFTRDEVTLASGANSTGLPLKPTTLLGKITASGKYVPHDPSASDGSEIVAGILYTPNIDAASADKTVIAVLRGPAVFRWDKLIQVNSLDAGQTIAAKANLLAINIKVK